MRIVLHLSCPRGSIMTASYNPAIQAAIYKILQQGNPDYSRMLHDSGYDFGGRNFKFFTFSELMIDSRFRLDKPSATYHFLESGKAELMISFLVPDALQHFVAGVFVDQYLDVAMPNGPRTSFRIDRVEMLPPPRFQSGDVFNTYSIICVNEKEEGQKQEQYRYPDDASFLPLLKQNLLSKYASAVQGGFMRDEGVFTAEDIDIEILNEPRIKSRVTQFKRPDADRILMVGSKFRFRMFAPVPLMRVGYYAGFGVKNPMGFGCCKWLQR